MLNLTGVLYLKSTWATWGLKGFFLPTVVAGVDEQTIIDVLTKRTYAQRREIAFAYERKAKKVTRVQIKSTFVINHAAVLTATPAVVFCLFFSGHDLSPEGGAVWLLGDADPRVDEEHNPVWRLGDQRVHEGKERGENVVQPQGNAAPWWSSHIFACLVFCLAVNVGCGSFRKRKVCLFQGLGTDEETLIEMLCSRSTEEMAEIKKVYTESECQFVTGRSQSHALVLLSSSHTCVVNWLNL